MIIGFVSGFISAYLSAYVLGIWLMRASSVADFSEAEFPAVETSRRSKTEITFDIDKAVFDELRCM
jgi:hypothetical protein